MLLWKLQCGLLELPYMPHLLCDNDYIGACSTNANLPHFNSAISFKQH